MAKYDGATIEVVNWDKYNPRTDAKRPTWFRLDNTLATSAGFHGLDCEQKWLWVVIMSLVSQKNGEPITWNSGYVLAITGIKEKKQDETIEVFEKFVRLRVSRDVTSKLHSESVRDSHATNITNEHNEHNEQNITNTVTFDLESIYRRYPRKLGKSKGIGKLEKEIRSQEDFEKLIVAVENYAASRRNQDPQYTKHFSTFVSEWRDWVAYTPEPQPMPDNSATRRLRGNQYALEQALASIGGDDEQAS